jgi:hypothetical protein
MTVLASITEQAYSPQTINATPVVSAGVKRIKLTLTRVAWPAGVVGTINVTMPDASQGPSTTFVGGTINRPGGVSTESSLEMVASGTGDLPAGTYGVSVVISQTVTTAVRVESF